MQKIIPLSKSEAWRLYNQGHQIVEMKNFRSPMILLKKGHGFARFQESQKVLALYLSKSESQVIHQTGAWRALKTIGAVYALSIGMILFGFWHEGSTTRFTPMELLVYSQMCLGLGAYCLVSVWESFSAEERAWEEMYQKYQVSDWKNS